MLGRAILFLLIPNRVSPSFQRVLSFSSNGYELTARENIESLPSWKRLLYMDERKGEEKEKKRNERKNFSFDTGNQ